MKAKQFFFVLIGVSALIIALGAGGFYLALINIKATSTKLSQALADQVAADNTLETITKLHYRYDHEIKPIIPLIDEALPRTKNQTELLAQLQHISADSGLNLSAVSFPSAGGLPNNTSQTVVSGTVLALPVSFQLIGSYTQLQSFLTKAENLSRFTNITTLSVTRPDKTKPITYTMTVNAYIKP